MLLRSLLHYHSIITVLLLLLFLPLIQDDIDNADGIRDIHLSILVYIGSLSVKVSGGIAKDVIYYRDGIRDGHTAVTVGVASLCFPYCYNFKEILPLVCSLVKVNAGLWNLQRACRIVHPPKNMLFASGWRSCQASNTLQAAAVAERRTANARHAVTNGHRGQIATLPERKLANVRHAVGNGHRGQAAATIKSRTADARHAVGNSCRGQTAATPESTTANARHAVGNSYCFQTAAILERPIANARHAVGNSDGCQATAIIVFISCFISDTYILNGRKVLTQILYRLKKL